jgi:DNA polymerase-2
MDNLQQGFLLTRHSRDSKVNNKNCTEIVLWLSTPSGPVKLTIDHQQPVFFVLQQHQDSIQQILTAHVNDWQYKPLPLKSFDQQPVAALYFDSMHGFYNAKELLQAAHITVLESDFRLQERFLMERFIYGGIEFIGKAKARTDYTEYSEVKVRPCDYNPQLSILSIDIECSMQSELFSIGFYGGKSGQAKDSLYRHVIMIGDPQPAAQWISWVPNELALLHALENVFNNIDPDIIIGWNVINFDFKVLIQRAIHHDIKLRLGRGGAFAHWRDSRRENNQGFITLPGRVVVDGIDAHKTATYNFPSFSLENVAQTLLSRGKKVDDVNHRIEEIMYDFIHNKVKLAAYNLEDCVLVWDIFEHTRLMDFLLFRSQLTGLELDRSGGSVAAFTNLYLPRLHRAGYVAPNLPADGGLASPGGYVMSSRPGLYEHVLVFDFKSLYPSIIRTFKIDPLGLIEGLLHPEVAIPGFKEAMFSRDQHFLPDIITKLWQQRDQAKRHHDAPRSQAIKILMNSFYGVLGSGGCRFYDTRLASSITLRGHEIMQTTAKWIEHEGLQVIYGDTDSIFVLLNHSCTNQRADEIGDVLTQKINQLWQQKLKDEYQLECFLEMEYETHFNRFLMPTIRGSEVGSKKRYAGLIQKDNKPEELVFKGLETVRTDWTMLAKAFQTELYQCVFHDKDPSEYVRQVVAQTLSGERDHQLIYRKRLRRRLSQYVKNVPPHVRAARLADEQNQNLNRTLQYQFKGVIAYVITIHGPEPLEYHKSALDYDHYIEKQLQPVADAILPFIGLSFDRLINKQMGLF